MCFRRQFLCKMWPIQLPFRCVCVCVCVVYSFPPWLYIILIRFSPRLVQLIFSIILQHQISKHLPIAGQKNKIAAIFGGIFAIFRRVLKFICSYCTVSCGTPSFFSESFTEPCKENTALRALLSEMYSAVEEVFHIYKTVWIKRVIYINL